MRRWSGCTGTIKDTSWGEGCEDIWTGVLFFSGEVIAGWGFDSRSMLGRGRWGDEWRARQFDRGMPVRGGAV